MIVDANLVYDTGEQRSWAARAYFAFGRVYPRYDLTAAAGMAGALNGNISSTIQVRGTLVPNADATGLSGVYTGDGFSGSESAVLPGDRYRWSSRVLDSVMAAHDLVDPDEVVERAIDLGNSNRYLNRSELTAAAAELAARPEIGIISDLDKTIIPRHTGTEMPPPYPGVVALYRELESKRLGDTSYVTARTPDRVTEVPAYLAEHGLPDGSIDTGTSTLPWVAQPEKVGDVSRVLDAHPDQKFVLLGDTSHRDPEVYQEIMAAYPDRIAAVVMHKVNNVGAQRVTGMLVIEDYAEAAALLMGAGVLDEGAALRVMVAAKREGLDLSNARMNELLDANRPD